MDISNEASNKWELSKENIQPLKQGRKAAMLSVALDEKSTQKLNVIRHEFEEELRTYSGDDPLDVWYRYALWVEQNYPKGGKEGNIMKLIEKCVTDIHSNSNTNNKYKNDQRMLNLWIKYANLYPSPVDIYQTIEKKGLCLTLAEFYINWSWELEKIGNYKQADNIYQKGLQMAAQPLHVLQEAHKKFQTRVVRSTLEGNTVNQDPENPEPQRVALTALKPQGRNNRVAAERVGAAVIGPAGRVHQSQSKENVQGPGFSVFQDNSGSAGIPSSKSSKGGSFGMGQRANQENVKAASHWVKAKVKQTAHVVPVEDVDKYQTPAFSLHEDDSVSHQTLAKLPQTSNVLSTRKKDLEDWQVELFIAEPFNPKVQPQYCKHKIYCGTEEFSFEELRAARFFKKEKEGRQKNEELLEIREKLKKQEEMIQLLLQQQINNKEVKAVPQVTVRSPSPPPVVRPVYKLDHKTQNSSRNIFQDSWVAINKSVNVSNVFDESSTRALLHCMPEAPCISSKESSVVHDPSPQKGKRDEFSVSVNNNGSRSLNMTDPTVETRKALNAMDDLFSLNFNYDTQQEPSHGLQPTAHSASKDTSPFSIFQDDGIKSDSDIKEDKSAAFQIFNDEPKEEEQSVPFQIFSDGPSLSEPPQLHELSKVNPAMEPKAVASKDLNDQYLDEQDENCDPAGSSVLGPRKTRPIMGILQPSTVVPLPPVDHTDSRADTEGAKATKDDENMIDGLEDIVPLDGTMGDFTLKMPTNLEAFAKHAKVASTPAPWAIALPEEYAVSDFGASEENHFPLIKDTEDGEDEKKENSGDLMPPPNLSSTRVSLAPHQNPPSPTPPPSSKVGLSPILEGSREYITSSSSSSSGYSTTSTTLGGHSIYGATHMSRSRHYSNTQPEPGHETGIASGADFTKSGYLADKSRGESIMDSKPSIIASQSEHQKDQDYFTFDTEAEAMMEKEIMLHPPLPPVHTTNNNQEKSGTPAFPENINPFCDDIIKIVLSSLKEPLERRGGYVALKTNLPPIKIHTQVSLGRELFHIRRVCGEGAYAVAYLASTMDPLNVTIMPTQEEEGEEDEDEEKQIILKTQNPSCPWEFYICHELRERLKARAGSPQILDSVMRINRGYFSASQSVLVNQYHKYGTLLDAVNGYRTGGQTMPEMIAIYYMIEVLSILEMVHKCCIIHADVKPDNFLIRDIPKVSPEATTPGQVFRDCPNSLKLIDFGRSIDMEKFPEGTTFLEVVTTDKFTCCEMREGRPWTYQTDLYGAAAIAHLLLFGSYMEVKRNTAGKWNISGVTLRRYWKKDMWQELFNTLLNVSSCSTIPSLAALKKKLMDTFCETKMYEEMNTKFSDLLLMLNKRRVK